MNVLFTIIYFCLLINILLVTEKRYKKIFLANTVFTIVWTTSGILSIIINIGTIRPSPRVHFYVIICIIVFNIIYLMFTKPSDVKKITNIDNLGVYKLNNKRVYFIELLAIILLSPNLIVSIGMIRNVGLNLRYIRESVYIITRFESNLLTFFTRAVPLSLFTTIMLIAIYELVTQNKRRLLYFVIINMLLEIITFGGRAGIWRFVHFLMGTLIVIKFEKKVKVPKRYFYMAFVLLVGTTLLRGDDFTTIIQTVYLYLVSPLSYLEFILKNPLEFGLKEPLLFGYLTFSFILEPIIYVLKSIIGGDIRIPSYFFNIYAQKFVNIGIKTTIRYNNNTTMLYPFIRDFGTMGIIVGTAVLAFLTCYFQRKGIRKNNLKYKLLLIYMYSIIIDSVRGYKLINTTLFFIFLTLTFVVVKSNEDKHMEKVHNNFNTK